MTTASDNGGQGAAQVKRHLAVAVVCTAIVATMVGLSFAAVPLYRLYCQVTGYGGTTQRAEQSSGTVLDRTLTVRFDSNVASGLPWKFEPEQRRLDVRIGENALAFYKATNTSDRPVTGTAVFNVTPESAGVHFNKVECFCFTEQKLEPGQSVDMAVSFYVDPAFVDDEDTKGLSELTLSYTFYLAGTPPNEEVQKKLGQAAASRPGGG